MNASTGPILAALGSSTNSNGKRPLETPTGDSAVNSQHRKANQPTPRRDFSRKLAENYIEYGKFLFFLILDEMVKLTVQILQK